METAHIGGGPPYSPIRVIGVGGCGVAVLSLLASFAPDGIDLIALDTDQNRLEGLTGMTSLLLGSDGGHGAGGNPELGRRAGEAKERNIRPLLEGASDLFITGGLGGGTGSGAIPVVVSFAATTAEAIHIIVSTPFVFEGSRRLTIAEKALADLKPLTSRLIVSPNEPLLRLSRSKPTPDSLFHQARHLLASRTFVALMDLFQDLQFGW